MKKVAKQEDIMERIKTLLKVRHAEFFGKEKSSGGHERRGSPSFFAQPMKYWAAASSKRLPAPDPCLSKNYFNVYFLPKIY